MTLPHRSLPFEPPSFEPRSFEPPSFGPRSFEPRFARVAAMIGDPTRARMLATLLDGTMRTAGEIARGCDVTPQTASAHLARLVDAGLLVVRAQGRHRYFRLADGDVAHALEALALVADRDADRPAHRRVWSDSSRHGLRDARTCYGHLAGRLGVRLHDALIDRGTVTAHGDAYVLSDVGRDWLRTLEIDPATIGSVTRSVDRGVAYPCVDWSERRDHFAGPLAVALLDRFVERRWLLREASTRALSVGPAGRPFFDALRPV